MERFDKDISVIFPAYNEEENVEACVLIAHCILKELVKDFEIILVNDGSTDRTKAICLDLEKRLNKVKVIYKEKNEGYGYALRDGFRAAKFDLVFFSDSDRQFDMYNLKYLLPYSDEYDLVIGYRRNRQDPLKRRLFSLCYNLLIRLMFKLNVKDINCAFKLFKKKIFDKIEIGSKQYVVNTEILAKARALGYTIKELGVSHFPRYEGDSKVGGSDILHTINEVIKIKRRLS